MVLSGCPHNLISGSESVPTIVGPAQLLALREALKSAGDNPRALLQVAVDFAFAWSGASEVHGEIPKHGTTSTSASAGRPNAALKSLEHFLPGGRLPGAGQDDVVIYHPTDLSFESQEICNAVSAQTVLVADIAIGHELPGLLVLLSNRDDAFGPSLCDAIRLLVGMLGERLQAGTESRTASRVDAENELLLASLRESNDFFRGAFEDASIGLVLANLSGRLIRANRAFCDLIGFNELEVLSLDLAGITHQEDAQATLHLLAQLRQGLIPHANITNRFLHKSGREIWVRVGVSPVSIDGQTLHLVVNVQDITEQKQVEWLEKDRRLILEMVAHDQPLPGVFHAVTQLIEHQISGARACVLLLNDGTLHTFAPSLPSELVDAIARRPVTFASRLVNGQMPPDLPPRFACVATDPAWQNVHEIALRHGVLASWSMSLRANDGAPMGLLVVCSSQNREPVECESAIMDAALQLATVAVEHHNTTRQLAHLVRHDPLTGVANRIFYEDRLEQALGNARRTGCPLALLAMDLNRFKSINDTLGHQAGDALLQKFAQRIRSAIREADTVARVGGDEFMVILPEVAGREDACLVAAKLHEALAAAPFEIGGQAIPVTSSIGVAIFPADGEDVLMLQRSADIAMYRAKEKTRHPCASDHAA